MAGVLMLSSLALHLRFQLPAGESPDLRPRQLPELELAFPFDREAGPVLVLIEYRVPLTNADAFVQAIDELGHIASAMAPGAGRSIRTRRMPSIGTRRCTVASWLHYLRQRRRRTTADEPVLSRARRYLDPDVKPVVRRMIARGPEANG